MKSINHIYSNINLNLYLRVKSKYKIQLFENLYGDIATTIIFVPSYTNADFSRFPQVI